MGMIILGVSVVVLVFTVLRLWIKRVGLGVLVVGGYLVLLLLYLLQWWSR